MNVNVKNKYKCLFVLFFSLPGRHIIDSQNFTVNSDITDELFSLFSITNITLLLHLYPTKWRGLGELKLANY